LSVAFVDTVTADPDTVAPDAGAVMDTDGGCGVAPVPPSWIMAAVDGTPVALVMNSM
jgi:hypothetical protein